MNSFNNINNECFILCTNVIANESDRYIYNFSTENSDDRPMSQKQNGFSLESKTECSDNIELDIEENTFYPDNDFDLDEDCAPDTGDDDSKSNDLSGDYQLNIALNNLKQIQDAVQSNKNQRIILTI